MINLRSNTDIRRLPTTLMALLNTLALGVLSCGTASGETLPPIIMSGGGTNKLDGDLQVPRFDTSIGILDRVDFEIDATISANADVRNTTGRSQNIKVRYYGTLKYSFPGISTPVPDLPPSLGGTRNFDLMDEEFVSNGATTNIGLSGYTVPTAKYFRFTDLGDYSGEGTFLVHFEYPSASMTTPTTSHGINPTTSFVVSVLYYYTPALVLGDYSGNGSVGPEDYDLWKSNLGNDFADADGNDDGTVNAADYTIWRDNYTDSAASLANIPERSTGCLIVAATIVLIGSRRSCELR